MATEFRSEQVVTESWMSFTGITTRIMLATARWPTWLKWACLTVPLLLLLAWTLVLAWYLCVFIWIWPLAVIWRGFGRNRRQRKVTELRHREMMDSYHRTAGPGYRDEQPPWME